MNGNELLMASALARQASEEMFRPISHAEYVRMERARLARVAKREDRRDARAERARRRRAVRTRVRLLLTPDSVERQAPALRP